MAREFTREQLETARRTCGCRLDLDAAMPVPALAICITNQTEAIAKAKDLSPRFKRMARYAGAADWRARAANDE